MTANDGEMLAVGSFELTVLGDTLFVRDNAAAKKARRTCGISYSSSNQPRQIPLYNILWAEYANDALTIDYAEDASKTRFVANRITIPFPSSNPPPLSPHSDSGAAADDAPYRDLEMGPEPPLDSPPSPQSPSNLPSKKPAATTTTTQAAESAYYPGHPPVTSATLEACAASLLDRAYDPAATRRRRAYVLVNPNAGPGGAVRKFETEVRPIFAAAKWDLTVVVTTRGGEGMDLCEQLDIDRYDVVVAVSGDGLAYEVFNGLGKRPDARRALSSVAVVHIPCGSGNAMACNLFGTHRPSAAALAAVKGVPTPMDLASLTQGDTRTLSFLSQALGVVAEADLATDDLRWMGPSRFTYGFLVRLFRRATYPCDIAVKVEIDDRQGLREHFSRHRSGGESTEALSAAGGGSGGSNANSILGGAAGGSVGRTVASSSQDSASAVEGAGGDGLPPLRWGTVNDKIPEGWEVIHYNNMGNFYCGNMAYNMADSNFFSAACINDGLMDLVTIDGDISPFKAISLMQSIDTGHFFDSPLVGYRKISAYRITPRDQPDGYISIDGERVPFQPFQCEVHQGLGLVLSRRGLYEAPGPRNWDRVSTSERLMA